MGRSTFLTPTADNSVAKSVVFCGTALGAMLISAFVFLYSVSSFFIVSIGYKLDFKSQAFMMIVYAFALMLGALIISIVSRVINHRSNWAKTNIILSSIFLGVEVIWFLSEMMLIYGLFSI